MSILDLFRLDDRAAIVTGGSKGLGEAMAQSLAEAGANVAITSRHLDECAATAERIAKATGRQILPLQADVSDPERVKQVVGEVADAFGRVDILVNNAGISNRKSLLDVSKDEWDAVIATNLTGPFLYAQAVVPYMIRNGYGRIINISSTFGMVGYAARSPYSASKAGLLNMTRTWALEFANDGITVNAVCPGPFDTPQFAPNKANKEWFEAFMTRIPMGRLGDPAELGAVITFLASGASSYMTGSAVVVDGGWTAQ